MTQPQFSRRIWELLRDGYGSDDIAVEMNCDVKHVRAEILILRGEGKLERLRGNTRWGPTAIRMMT